MEPNAAFIMHKRSKSREPEQSKYLLKVMYIRCDACGWTKTITRALWLDTNADILCDNCNNLNQWDIA
jgi:hypothetical protein